jgi:hypothetical protein
VQLYWLLELGAVHEQVTSAVPHILRNVCCPLTIAKILAGAVDEG